MTVLATPRRDERTTVTDGLARRLFDRRMFAVSVAFAAIAFAAPLGSIWFLGLPAAIAVGCVVLEARRYGSLNRVFLAGTIGLVCSYPARLTLMSTDAWTAFATFATSVV